MQVLWYPLPNLYYLFDSYISVMYPFKDHSGDHLHSLNPLTQPPVDILMMILQGLIPSHYELAENLLIVENCEDKEADEGDGRKEKDLKALL